MKIRTNYRDISGKTHQQHSILNFVLGSMDYIVAGKGRKDYLDIE